MFEDAVEKAILTAVQKRPGCESGHIILALLDHEEVTEYFFREGKLANLSIQRVLDSMVARKLLYCERVQYEIYTAKFLYWLPKHAIMRG